MLLKHEAVLREAGMNPAIEETVQMMKKEMLEVREQLKRFRQQMKDQEHCSRDWHCLWTTAWRTKRMKKRVGSRDNGCAPLVMC